MTEKSNENKTKKIRAKTSLFFPLLFFFVQRSIGAFCFHESINFFRGLIGSLHDTAMEVEKIKPTTRHKVFQLESTPFNWTNANTNYTTKINTWSVCGDTIKTINNTFHFWILHARAFYPPWIERASIFLAIKQSHRLYFWSSATAMTRLICCGKASLPNFPPSIFKCTVQVIDLFAHECVTIQITCQIRVLTYQFNCLS